MADRDPRVLKVIATGCDVAVCSEWDKTIGDAMEKIWWLIGEDAVKFTQIKSKFGFLCIYYHVDSNKVALEEGGPLFTELISQVDSTIEWAMRECRQMKTTT